MLPWVPRRRKNLLTAVSSTNTASKDRTCLKPTAVSRFGSTLEVSLFPAVNITEPAMISRVLTERSGGDSRGRSCFRFVTDAVQQDVEKWQRFALLIQKCTNQWIRFSTIAWCKRCSHIQAVLSRPTLLWEYVQTHATASVELSSCSKWAFGFLHHTPSCPLADMSIQ